MFHVNGKIKVWQINTHTKICFFNFFKGWGNHKGYIRFGIFDGPKFINEIAITEDVSPHR